MRRPPFTHLRRCGPLWLAVCLCLAFAHGVRASDLVLNSTFDSDLEGWQVFTGPEFKQAGANATAKRTLDTAHSGGASAELTTDVPIRYGLAMNLKAAVPVEAGGRYKVAAWVKFAGDARPEAGKAACYVRLAMMESETKTYQGEAGLFHVGLDGKAAWGANVVLLNSDEVPHDWHKIEGVVEIPAGVSHVLPALFINRITGTAYWDDVTLEKVPKTVAVSPVLAK